MSRPSVRPWCPRCGVRWVQVGDRTGHCSGCHRTFSSERAFDDHRRDISGRRGCLDPATVTTGNGRPVYAVRTDAAGAEVWFQPVNRRVPHWPSHTMPCPDDDPAQAGETGEREGSR